LTPTASARAASAGSGPSTSSAIPFSAAAGAAAAWWCGPAAAPVARAVASLYGIPCTLPRRDAVALTFDDGPHPQGTPAVLEVLERAGARATFFLVGEQVERHPSLAAELVAAGHEVAIHGHRHVLLLRRPPRAVARDFDLAAAAIAAATGCEPTLYRPPYGVLGTAALALVRARGWRPLLWSRWGRDWAGAETRASIARRATAGLAPGDVVLLHDSDAYSDPGSWRTTAAALDLILPAL
jgi:peptidoglycan/xylan/chitin deacetylase (PgdA/CDA1 family)